MLGLTTGLVVFIVGITGAIYCWEEEVRGIMYDDMYHMESPDRGNYVTDSAIAVAQRAHPGQKVKFIRIARDMEAVEVGFKDKESVFVDPFRMRSLGSYNRDNDFFGIVLQIHRRLMLGDTGKLITGISCLVFGFMLLSGIYLWWPRSKSIRRQRFRIAMKAPRARKIFDLHSVVGFYAAWILLFSVVTGLVWSFKWFEKGMYAVVGSEKKEMRYESEPAPRDSAFSIDALLNASMAENPTAEEWFVSLPEDSAGVIRINSYLPQDGFFKEQNQIFYNQFTGEVVGRNPFSEWSTGEQLKSSNFDIHTGRKFGLIGKLIMFFAALIAASLPITGFLYWRIRTKAAAGKM